MTKPIGVWFPTIRAGTGVDRFTERLVQKLRQRGIRAEIQWLPHRAEYLPWTVSVPDPPSWATVVHVNSWLHRRFLPVNLPLVVTLHSCVHDGEFRAYKSIYQALYHRLWVYKRETEALKHADKVTAVSRYTATAAERVFGSHAIKTIPNWVDTDVFVPNEVRSEQGPFRLLFVGNLSRRKGADLLPEIMRRLGSDYELRYTGLPRDLPNHRNVPDNMIPLGQIVSLPDLLKVYWENDALLFPTRLEGLPLVALEASACGMPVIASKATSLPEAVMDGSTGLLCEKDNVDCFVNAARKLKSSPDLFNRMKKQARAFVASHFSESEILDAYINVYGEVSG